MPFVKIDLFEGRTEEQKIELAREVTEVVSRVAKAPRRRLDHQPICSWMLE